MAPILDGTDYVAARAAKILAEPFSDRENLAIRIARIEYEDAVYQQIAAGEAATTRQLLGIDGQSVNAQSQPQIDARPSARIRNAISRMADWVNGLAVELFDVAGRLRGMAGAA